MKAQYVIFMTIFFAFKSTLLLAKAGKGWRFSNEYHSENFFSGKNNHQQNAASSGVYLSVGGDRIFNGAAMAMQSGINITGLIQMDRDPEVISFFRALKQSVNQASSKDDLNWSRLLDKVSFFDGAQTLFSYYLNYRNYIYYNNIYQSDLLFSQAKHLALLPSASFNLDLSSPDTWESLLQYLKQNRQKIAVLDVSNVLQGYISRSGLRFFLTTFKEFFTVDSLLVTTQFCTKVGHIHTHVFTIEDALSRLESRYGIPTGQDYPSCVYQKKQDL